MADQVDTFEEEPVREMYDLVLDLDGFEGPIDLLLTLARQQKVDLAKMSILETCRAISRFHHRCKTASSGSSG